MNADMFIFRLNKDLEGIVKIDKYGFFGGYLRPSHAE